MTASTNPATTLQGPVPAPGSPRPRLHLVVVPTPGPPLQDEREPVRLLVPGRRARRLAPPPGPRPRLDLPAVPGDAADFGPTWSRRAELPDPQAVGRRLITLTLEAMAGRRPLSQLQPLTSPGVFGALTGGRRPAWCVGSTSPLLVGRLHVCEPVDGVAEISAVARRDGRAHAVAARLEGIDGRWRCTALQIG